MTKAGLINAVARAGKVRSRAEGQALNRAFCDGRRAFVWKAVTSKARWGMEITVGASSGEFGRRAVHRPRDGVQRRKYG